MKQKISQLTEEVKKHDLLYSQERPIITDSEYDLLFNRLVQLEKEYPQYKRSDSPTEKIYSVLIDELGKVAHDEPLLSLEKINDNEGIERFLNRFSDNVDIVVWHKEDGLSVKLEYEGGYLQRASTRGDGNVGEDITHTIRLLDSVPNHISYKGRVVVRGEAVIKFEDFERLNKDGKYRSPRNLVSGSVRTLEAKTAKERGVEVLVFDLMNAVEIGKRTVKEAKKFLEENNFKVSFSKIFQNSLEGREELISYCENFEYKERDKVDHMIDGLVLEVGNYSDRERMGVTSKYPKWAIAYKFDSLDATTTLKGVEWTVGKTGQVTPNAILEPVEIDGVLIRKASLANYANIVTRDIRIGDTVIVARANDVIPQVVSAVREERTGNEQYVELIENCPECNHVLDREIGKDGKGDKAITLYCRNIDCEEQKIRVLENFVSRDAMDIDGLGKVTVKKLYEEEIVTDIPSIFLLKNKKEEVLQLEGFGERSYEKMVKGIEEAKKQPLERVIRGLGIRNIGNFVSGILTEKYFSWEELKIAAKTGELQKYLQGVRGVGSVLEFAILNTFTDDEVIRTMDQLQENGCLLEQEKKEEVQGNLEGTFVLTGTMYKGRNDIKKDIEALGGKVVGSVSRNTDYLVLGGYNDLTGAFEGKQSSKHKRALELGIPIISDVLLRDKFLQGK